MKIFNGETFINDEQVIGKWKFCGEINSLEDFNENLPNFTDDAKELYFLPKGKGYWIYEGWSKGYLFVWFGGNAPILKYEYTLKDINSNLYLFLFTKNEDGEPGNIEIYKKQSSAHFEISDFKIKENINLPFVNDPQVIGKWKSVGYVETMEDFSASENYEPFLFLKTIEFKSNGEVERIYFNDTTNWKDTWTNGLLLDKVKEVASKYIIKQINNEDYMFMEWKMGNYVYARQKPWFYVFKRDK